MHNFDWHWRLFWQFDVFCA
uniref:Uncharacterized protein n=1 Tax=Arundo donax TaxID=35708 RepID=A0A0A9GSZ9_ARUDO